MKRNTDFAGCSSPERKKLKTEPYSACDSDIEFEYGDVLEDSDRDDLDDDYWRSSDSGDSDLDEKPEGFSDNEEFADNAYPVCSKSFNLDWVDDPASMQHYEFTKFESLLVAAPEPTPLEYFRMMLTDEILAKIVEDANNNALEIFMSEKTKEKSMICQWKPLTIDEFLVFLGVLLHMGNVKMTRLHNYWKRDPLFLVKGIAMSMGRNRFLIILRALNFCTKNKTEKLCRIRPLVEHFNKTMNDVFYPGRELNMSEPMVVCWDRTGFHRFMNNDKRKYGIKFHLLKNPGGLIQKFTIDSGTPEHAFKVVMNLMKEKLNAGHHLYLDEYYSSLVLVKELLSKKTHCTGLVESNCKFISESVRTKKLNRGETIASYCDGVMVGKWKKIRSLMYISSRYENVMIKVENGTKEKKSKPVAVVEYRKNMSGIDRYNQMQYLSDRKTIRWGTKVFVHILEMMVFNTHFLFNKFSGKRITLFDFRLSVIKDLLPSMEEPVPVLGMPMGHILTKRPIAPGRRHALRKKCKKCSREGRRTDTIYMCMACPDEAGYCLYCSVIYHK
ncbi:hypothetical protein WA026_009529 [Henosepilachna vigintioctopunctata]|uniref:PiggyBac transposable element-derived protein domain-containing protein n=1 Tax=Henosepilachna vigintioctopunctata TaxID=420089 RepID=A0AAW1U731_9CUCU